MPRYAAADVYYPTAGGAVAAAVVATDPRFSPPLSAYRTRMAEVAPYRPGAFFERELPALRAVLATAGPVDLLVVDGYVTLDPAGRPGLGAHAYAAFGIPVIGVAKTAFLAATHAAEVFRGGSRRALYVTAEGISTRAAAVLVEQMAGAHRLPDALRQADQLSRSENGE